MQNVKLRLDAWRAAEHRRDTLALGSPEWQEADEEARIAEKAFHAELAQTSALYAEQALRDPNRGWATTLDRQTSRAGD